MIITAQEVADRYGVDVEVVGKVFGALVEKGYAKIPDEDIKEGE